MKIIRLILAILAILFTLFMAIVTPVALIGTLIVAFGLYQSAQKRKGNLTFSKPGWFIAIGLILTVILTSIYAEPVQETAKEVDSNTQLANKEEKKEKEKQEVKAKKEAEEKEAAEAKKKEEAKAKAEEEAKAKAAAEAKAKEQKEQKELTNKFNLEAVTVYRAVDGDTLELSDGRKIRLIGVNTPESTTRHEEFGKEASNYTSEQLKGKKVWMQKDVSDTDRYNRYLRIIWLDIPTNDMSENEIRAKMFNAKLVLNGYAEPSTYSPDVKYSDSFVKFAREARANNTGLWAYGNNGTTKGDLDPKKSTTTASTSTPKTSTSKPSSSTSTPKPAAPAPTPTPAPAPKVEYYQNCTELRKVYPNGVPSTHPAYASKHDRDKDNFACER